LRRRRPRTNIVGRDSHDGLWVHHKSCITANPALDSTRDCKSRQRQNRQTASNRRRQQRSGTMMCGAGLHKDRRKSTAGLRGGDTRDGRAVHWKQSSESCNIYGVSIELELDCARVRLPQVFHPEADARESWMHNEGEENGEAGGTHLTTNAHLCMYFREAQCAAMRPAYKRR
jgi:hypothetical protein